MGKVPDLSPHTLLRRPSPAPCFQPLYIFQIPPPTEVIKIYSPTFLKKRWRGRGGSPNFVMPKSSRDPPPQRKKSLHLIRSKGALNTKLPRN